MRKKIYFYISLNLLCLLFIIFVINLFGCTQREKIIEIGSQNVYSGEFKSYGQEQLVSMSLAAKELAPVIIGGYDHKISIVAKDDEGNPEKSFLVSQELIQEEVLGVIGSAFNATTKAAIPNYLEYNIPIITTSAPGDDLAKPGSNFFRVIISNNQVVENVAKFIINEIKPHNAVFIDDGSEYSVNFINFLSGTIKDNETKDFEIIKQYSLKPETEDYKLLAENLLLDGADLIFFCGEYNVLAKIATEARTVGVQSLFLTEKQSMSEGILQLAEPEFLEGIMSIIPQPPSLAMFSEDPKAIEFWRKFKDTASTIKGIDISEPGEFAPYAYDAFYVIIEAMKNANSILPEDYIDDLRNISYDGVTGKIEFDSSGNLKDPQSTVFIIKNGSWVRYQK